MSLYEEIILVRIGLDSGTKYYARSDVVGDHFYEGRVLGSEAIGREISVLPRDIRVSDIGVTLDNTDQALSALAMAETFIQKDLTILMGAVGSGESNYEVRAKGKIYSAKYRQDKFEIRAADEMYFQLDETLAGARVNPEYFPDLPEGSEEALVPLVIGDPGVRFPGHRIHDTDLLYVLAQGRIPTPTVYVDGAAVASPTIARQSYGGAVVTTFQADSGHSVTFTIGAPDLESSSRLAWFTSIQGQGHLFPPALLSSGGVGYLNTLDILASSGQRQQVLVDDDDIGSDGTRVDLNNAWEINTGAAITVRAGSLTLVFAGPSTGGHYPIRLSLTTGGQVLPITPR